jgi:hypothetical protein
MNVPAEPAELRHDDGSLEAESRASGTGLARRRH